MKLTIEQMREIVAGAPEGADTTAPVLRCITYVMTRLALSAALA